MFLVVFIFVLLLFLLLLGTVQILCDPLRGEGGGSPKDHKRSQGGEGGSLKRSRRITRGGGGHGRPPMHYKRANENLQLS